MTPISRAMIPGGSTNSPPGSSRGDTTNSAKVKKAGRFFITPFYQYTHFTKLKLTANKNYFIVPGGETSETYQQGDIDEYNKYYGTEYSNSMMGIKVGYQVFNGLGINVYAGVCNFNLKSWISRQNTQTLSTQYPGLLLGVSVDYELQIWKKLSGMALGSINYCRTGSGQSTSPTGNDIVGSKLTDIYWEVNLALAYHLGRFLPYAGAGFTQQFLNTVTTEQYVTNDVNGNPFTEQDRFDTHFRGTSLYGFAGLEFFVNRFFSVYARGTFVNPARATAGFRITL